MNFSILTPILGSRNNRISINFMVLSNPISPLNRNDLKFLHNIFSILPICFFLESLSKMLFFQSHNVFTDLFVLHLCFVKHQFWRDSSVLNFPAGVFLQRTCFRTEILDKECYSLKSGLKMRRFGGRHSY